MTMTRRQWLAASLALPALSNLAAVNAADKNGIRLGIVVHSFHLRLSADRKGDTAPGMNDPLHFLDYCHRLGAGGIQLDLGVRDKSYLSELRQRTETHGMFLEGSIRLPRDKSDLDRFTAEVRTAKEAGAKVLRAVMMSGRRYENFDSADAFRRAADRSWESLVLAEPIVAHQGVRLAIENHKDFRSEELIGILRKLNSPHVGVCVD